MQTPQKFQTTVTHKIDLKYLLYLPPDYAADSRKTWPLMLFLHGAGERGTNLTKVAVHGPPKLLQAKKDLPFIVVSPQCPVGKQWRPDELLPMLDDIIARHRVDTNRVYVTGLSMGGYGTWALATEAPERFAAVAPICGGGQPIRVFLASPENRNALKSMGVWAFHGAKDQVVRVEESEKMIAAFKQIGNKAAKLTVYPEAGHDSWTETYNNPELYKWLLEHRR